MSVLFLILSGNCGMTRTGLSNSCITVWGMNDTTGALSGNIPVFSDSYSDAVSSSHSWPSLAGFSSFLFHQPCASRLLLQSFAHTLGFTTRETGELGCTRLMGQVNGNGKWELKPEIVNPAESWALNPAKSQGMYFPEDDGIGVWA